MILLWPSSDGDEGTQLCKRFILLPSLLHAQISTHPYINVFKSMATLFYFFSFLSQFPKHNMGALIVWRLLYVLSYKLPNPLKTTPYGGATSLGAKAIMVGIFFFV